MVTAVLFAIHAPPERAMAAHDAIHGIWMQAATMPAPEMSHEAVLLRDGRVMVLGGEPLLGVPVSWTQVYDPSTRSWSTSESMHFARIGFTASVLGDGRVLVVGGVDDNLNDLGVGRSVDSGDGHMVTASQSSPDPVLAVRLLASRRTGAPGRRHSRWCNLSFDRDFRSDE